MSGCDERMHALIVAGSRSSTSMLATHGCLPFRRTEGNTQSLGWEYVVCFQWSMNSASNGWSGTGPFDALLFGKPNLATRPSTTHVDHSIIEIDVMPLQAQAFR